MAKNINDTGLGHAAVVLDYSQYFSNGSITAGRMRSQRDLTFHIWTTSNSDFHSHENYLEIFIVTSGKLLHQFGGKTMVMKTGDAFLMFPGQYHQHRQYKDYTSQHINVTCSLPFAASLFHTFYGTEQPVFPQQLIHLTESEFSVVTNMQNAILRSRTSNHLHATLRSMLSFLFNLFYVAEYEAENGEHLPKWLQQFLLKLQDIDFSDPVQLSGLYTMSGYAQTALSRNFKKYMGQTLVAYINNLKLNHACNQIINTSFSLSEIACSAGFESYPHFSRLFKSRFGMNPRQYRNAKTQLTK